ncbi:hypothetical protein SPI_02399 [Niveomyces insectorum RCEF 264]|uniref:Uncharacterized protein n=1 Tax=Niveomyces insectorum RCEF 264 TaxID=1081102 RepID=A0A162J9A9_9HYPO|nr:hypothetical protein SPI_02399 [Niveomyces insectorum RCEF 264]
MPSVKNPNKPSRNRLAARASHQRKQQRKRAADGVRTNGVRPDRVAKADTKRGARPGLLPTSGPRAPLSAKKQKKVVQRMALALKRKWAANGGAPEVDMADATPTEAPTGAAESAETAEAAATEDATAR